MPIVYDGSVNLPAAFAVKQGAEDLPAEFFVNQGTEDLLGIFEVGGTLASVDLPAGFFSRNATTVGATAAAGNDPILDPYQRGTFYAARRRWVFYSDGINLAFRSSADGVTWSAKTMVRPCIRGDQFSIHFDGTYVHYVYISGLQGQGHGVYYCRGVPQANGTITWSQVEQRAIQVGEPTAETYSRPSVSVDSYGYPWIAYHFLWDDNGNPANYVYAIKSQQNDGSFTGDPFPVRIDAVGEFEPEARIIILPLGAGRMYCLWDKGDDILGRLHTGPQYDDWDSEEDTGADIAAPGLFDAVSYGNSINLVWTEKTTFKLQHKRYSSGIWSASHEIYDAVLGDIGPSISRGSGEPPDLFVFWAPDENNPTADHVFFKTSTDKGVNWTAAPIDWIDDSADGFPLPNQQSSFFAQNEFYIGCIWVRTSPDDIRYYELDRGIANGFLDLPAQFEVGQGRLDLPAQFEVGQGSLDLPASFDAQAVLNLPARFEVGQGAVDLPAEFFLMNAGVANLPGKFIVRHTAILDLPGEFIVRHTAILDLPGEFIIRQETSVDLIAEFIVRHEAIQNLPGEFIVRHTATLNLPAEFIIRHETSVDLFASFEGQTSVDLPGKFIVRHTAIQNLPGKFIIRHETSVNLPAEFIVRHTATPLNLPGEFILRQERSVNLPAEFIVRHTATLNLAAEFIVRYSSSATLGNLPAKFAVRSVYPYWTDRRYINGVIDAAEGLIGDAKLEFIIEGVMDDIKVWADANVVSYDTWTNIDVTPTAIKRATTYGTVAALYARHTKTFQGQVIPTLTPVAVTIAGEQEKAMEHWVGKMQEMLELYLTAQGFERIWVSTADEEPVFTMEDIPPDVTTETAWHEWLRIRET